MSDTSFVIIIDPSGLFWDELISCVCVRVCVVYEIASISQDLLI